MIKNPSNTILKEKIYVKCSIEYTSHFHQNLRNHSYITYCASHKYQTIKIADMILINIKTQYENSFIDTDYEYTTDIGSFLISIEINVASTHLNHLIEMKLTNTNYKWF